MQLKFLKLLACPSCESDLEEARGGIACKRCRRLYPILGGVLILVEDVAAYLVEHAKGISRYVEDQEIPKEYLADYRDACGAIETEHIEEDLEAERVTALYLMTHYLDAKHVSSPDPLLNSLIKKHWDHGPFAEIKKMLSKNRKTSLIELGCGVGGLFAALKGHLATYLGLDSSFASIAAARHFILGHTLAQKKCRIPNDLLDGPVSREIKIPVLKSSNAEFIVCDLNAPPVKPGQWDVSAALNLIDMLEEPQSLARLQYDLLKPGGLAIQSCPYVWHPQVAASLRRILPKNIRDSAQAVEHLYREAGFKIQTTKPHVPWLFFKHIRQLEIYSVHLFSALKT